MVLKSELVPFLPGNSDYNDMSRRTEDSDFLARKRRQILVSQQYGLFHEATLYSRRTFLGWVMLPEEVKGKSRFTEAAASG